MWGERDQGPSTANAADEAARADMLAQCYAEMRSTARRLLAGNAMGRILQPTELANEAAIRLIRANLAQAQDAGHMLATAARAMRQVIVDEVRKASAAKRQEPVLMTAWPGGGEKDGLVDMADLDRALEALAALSPIRAQIVELRFMLGMTVTETAAATRVPERTVKRHWQAARAWLLDHLEASAASGS
jgi:RNA polymerase sigma factor (TIGR02999 family)